MKKNYTLLIPGFAKSTLRIFLVTMLSQMTLFFIAFNLLVSCASDSVHVQPTAKPQIDYSTPEEAMWSLHMKLNSLDRLLKNYSNKNMFHIEHEGKSLMIRYDSIVSVYVKKEVIKAETGLGKILESDSPVKFIPNVWIVVGIMDGISMMNGDLDDAIFYTVTLENRDRENIVLKFPDFIMAESVAKNIRYLVDYCKSVRPDNSN